MADQEPPYLVDVDNNDDPSPPTNALGKFFSMRFSKRRDFFDHLDPGEQLRIRQELRRIKLCKKGLQDGSLSFAPDIQLIKLLESLRREWRKDAATRSQKGIEGLPWPPEIQHRNRLILEQVTRWRDGSLPVVEELVPDMADSTESGLECDARLTLVMPEAGIVSHRAIAIQELLSDSATPLTRTEETGTIRWFHLPTNNMAWVEVCKVSTVAGNPH